LYSTSGGEISHQSSHKDQCTMMLHGLPPRLMLIIGAAYAKAIKHHLIINLNLSKNLLSSECGDIYYSISIQFAPFTTGASPFSLSSRYIFSSRTGRVSLETAKTVVLPKETIEQTAGC
jgi:hypothetical protein